MANHSVDGQIQRFDRAKQRIAAGTIGGDHTVPFGIGGSSVSAVIDDSVTSIEYGTYDGTTFTVIDQDTMVTNGQLQINYAYAGLYGGTNRVFQTTDVACRLKFNGPSIAVMTALNEAGASFKVYIDGQLAKGRTNVFTPLASYSTPVSATDTSIPVLSSAYLPSSGEICIGDEIISYTSTTTYTLDGCVRGLYGTTPVEHPTYETIYKWSDTVTTAYPTGLMSSRRVSWSNHLLDPGEHEIIVRQTTAGTVAIDGFIAGQVVSARNLRTFIDCWTFTGTTDLNGFVNIGVRDTFNPQDVVHIGYMGHTQTSPSTSAGASTLGKVAVRATGTSSLPYYYYHGGPASTSVTIVVYFTYIGGVAV